MSASLTVQLYSGHSSTLSLTVFATNQAGIITVFVQSINVLSPNLKNYTLRVPLSPGVYRFTVKVNNSFGSTEKSNVYPPVGMDGIEGLKSQLNFSMFYMLHEFYFSPNR